MIFIDFHSVSEFSICYFCMFECVIYHVLIFCNYLFALGIQRLNMSDDCVMLKIPNAREKLKVAFPEDPRGDFRIVFKSKVFKLQKAYLRLESGYFKKFCTPTKNILQITQNFDESFFYNILFCFYGATIEVDRSDLPHYYPIIRFLEIESLINFIRKDILEFIDHYDLFVVMRIAHTFSDQQLFEVCLEQLERQSFEQLKYHQFELLQTDLPLFKLIIKTHNRFRSNGNNGIPYLEIDKILREYCEANVLGLEKYQELKFQLIDKTSLSSAEYKEIFLDDAIKMKTRQSMIMDSNEKQSQSMAMTGGLNKFVSNTNLAESVLAPPTNTLTNPNKTFPSTTNVTNQLTLEMQNTFQKKKNEQLKNENIFLSGQLQNLRKMTKQNTDIHIQMETELKKLKQELKRKETIENQHKKKISLFQKAIEKMQKELLQKSMVIDDLIEQFQQLKKRKPLEDDEEVTTEDLFVQSQFLPAHLINEMMGGYNQPPPKPPAKNEEKEKEKEKKSQPPASMHESIDEEEIEEMYTSRLKFDEEPISTPKINLPKLVGFVCGDDFNRKILNLIYRRSKSHGSRGENNDLKNRNNLLILIHTATEHNIGGYISVPLLPESSSDYVRDPGAFIFTLNKNQKFNVKKSQVDEAIFLSDQYLISFAGDLMISSNCLVDQSYCSWPSSYEGTKGAKDKGPAWLAGGNGFLIQDIEIYELSEEEMVMEL